MIQDNKTRISVNQDHAGLQDPHAQEKKIKITKQMIFTALPAPVKGLHPLEQVRSPLAGGG